MDVLSTHGVRMSEVKIKIVVVVSFTSHSPFFLQSGEIDGNEMGCFINKFRGTQTSALGSFLREPKAFACFCF